MTEEHKRFRVVTPTDRAEEKKSTALAFLDRFRQNILSGLINPDVVVICGINRTKGEIYCYHSPSGTYEALGILEYCKMLLFQNKKTE